MSFAIAIYKLLFSQYYETNLLIIEFWNSLPTHVKMRYFVKKSNQFLARNFQNLYKHYFQETQLYEGLKRMTQGRLDDQRGTEINMELPDFLKQDGTSSGTSSSVQVFKLCPKINIKRLGKS